MYQRMIREATGCSDAEARYAEAWMRLEYGTLDSLDRATFKREAEIALLCARSSTFSDNEMLAHSEGVVTCPSPKPITRKETDMLTITLDIGGFTLAKGEGSVRCSTYFPARRYAFAVHSVVPFITAHRLATDAYRLEQGPFLRAYDALKVAGALQHSIRYIDSRS